MTKFKKLKLFLFAVFMALKNHVLHTKVRVISALEKYINESNLALQIKYGISLKAKTRQYPELSSIMPSKYNLYCRKGGGGGTSSVTAKHVTEMTKALIVVGIVFVPIGIGAITAMNTSGMSPTVVLAIGSIVSVAIAAVVLSFLKGL